MEYLCPCQLFLNVFIVWFHVTCKLQVADSVLVAAINTLKNTNTLWLVSLTHHFGIIHQKRTFFNSHWKMYQTNYLVSSQLDSRSNLL